ncbi:MAG: hypothetical protein CBC82_07180 [Cellvibrionales bacterium TMED122]|nr:MAG: hypothetical protein CBC82_07180 [Cellvibrionales bacterium TMED122]|tara:strand:+ start:333 stop:845 length:513 start_codon:yes stop_codon:yes gene_type:complete
MKNWKQKPKSVFFSKKKEKLFLINLKKLNLLKLKKNQKDLKSRICVHNNNNDLIHEMFVFHKKGAYVRPHKHLVKLESFMILDGEVELVIFSDKGKIIKKINMGAPKSGKPFFYKMKKNFFHTQIIKRDTLFKEVTSGPFKKNKTLMAKWSPESKNLKEVKKFLKFLNNH